MVHDKAYDGVDRMDQMMSYYTFQRKTIKWWRKVFFWLLEVIVHNAFTLYRVHTSSTRKLSLKDFRRQLAVELCQGIVQNVSSMHRRHDQSLERLQGRHFPDKSRKRRDCRVCSKRGAMGERRLVNTICATCTEKPALCVGDCFHIYHTRNNL